MANINIFHLGGQDENGKNSTVIEVEDKIYLINVGIKVPVNNKTGIDGVIPDFSYLVQKKDRIEGVFITHAHDENFAALPWLIMDIKDLKIYGSNFTIKVAKERISKYKLGHNKYTFIEINDSLKIGKLIVEAFDVANSIAGSKAFNFKTEDGDILFISNYTNDDLGIYGKTSLENIKNKVRNPLALIVDSRRSNYHGKSSTMKSVKKTIEQKFKLAKDDERIIVGAYDEEMFTIQEIIDLAQKYNRPISIYGRAYDFLYKELTKNNPQNKPIKFIGYKNLNVVKNVVVLVTGTWSRLFKRIVRIAHNNDVFLKLKTNDVFIMIAPPVNGLEVEASQSLDEVAKICLNITDVTDKEYFPTRPTQEDIFELVSIIKPKFFLPISALYRYMVVASKAAIKAGVTQDKNLLLHNGKIAYFKNSSLVSQNSKLKVFGDVIIDGFGAGDISHEVIRERQTLGAGGLVSISTLLSKKSKTPIGDINIQLVGIATKSEINNLQEKVKNVVIQKLEDLERWDYREAQNMIRKKIRKTISKLTNKEPLVITTFFEV